jgi:hypothetical protein
MKLLETKSVKINGTDYPLKMTMRAMIEFEKLSGHTISTVSTLEDVTIMFYCTVKAGGAKLSYDEFLDLIDDHPEVLNSFTDAMSLEEEKKTVVR